MPSLFYMPMQLIWKQRGLLNAKNSTVTYGAEILQLIEMLRNQN